MKPGPHKKDPVTTGTAVSDYSQLELLHSQMPKIEEIEKIVLQFSNHPGFDKKTALSDKMLIELVRSIVSGQHTESITRLNDILIKVLEKQQSAIIARLETELERSHGKPAAFSAFIHSKAAVSENIGNIVTLMNNLTTRYCTLSNNNSDPNALAAFKARLSQQFL